MLKSRNITLHLKLYYLCDRNRKTKQLSAGNLRAAYGKIAAHFYCPPECEPILYTGKILGHQCDNYSTESLATTIHYDTYRIETSPSQASPALRDRNEEEVTNSPVSDRTQDKVTNSPVDDRTQDEVTDSPVRLQPTPDNAISGTRL